jgi:two-component system chemotaxis response regulator CheB
MTAMDDSIKVVVIDDASFMRKRITEILESDRRMQVVGSARNGEEGIKIIKNTQPDVITLDIDMPVMDGITAIKHIMIESPVPIVVLSSMFADGEITFEALRLGVVDFIPKPAGAVSQNIDEAKQQIIDRTLIATSVNLENIRRVYLEQIEREDQIIDRYRYRPLEYVLIVGTTLSGPNTIIRLLANLPPDLPLAVVACQEISSRLLDSFVKKFDEHVPWKIEVARADQPLQQGTCYVNPVENPIGIGQNEKGNPCLVRSKNGHRPLDFLLATAADVFHENTIGLLLTGLGDDGARGLARIKTHSGITIAQKRQTCVYPNLADNAISRGVVDVVMEENKLPETIKSFTGF